MSKPRLPELVEEDERRHRWTAMAGAVVAVVTGVSLASGSHTDWLAWVVFVGMSLLALNALWALSKMRRID